MCAAPPCFAYSTLRCSTPDASFAAGLIDGYFSTVQAEKARKDKNALDAADFLIKTGRVRNYNDLLPLIGSLGDDSSGKIFKRGGKGGKGTDPHSILAQFIDPALKASQSQQGQPKTLGGQAQPSFQQPQQQQSPLLSEPEFQQQQTEALKQKQAIETEGSVERERLSTRAKYEELVREGRALVDSGDAKTLEEGIAMARGTKPVTPRAPQAERDVQPDPSSPTGYVRLYLGPDGSEVRREPAPAPSATKPSATEQKITEKAKEYQAAEVAAGRPKPSDEDAAAHVRVEARYADVQKGKAADALLTKRYIDIDKDKDSLDLLREKKPLLLKAMQLKFEMDSERLAVLKGGKATKPEDYHKILTHATDVANRMLAAQQKGEHWWSGIFSDPPTLDDIRDQLLKDYGYDPETVKSEAAKPPTAAAAPAAGKFYQDPKGNWIIRTPTP